MSEQRLAFFVELIPERVAEYVANHERVWPEVEARFRLVGIDALSLFLHGTFAFLHITYAGDRPFAEALAEYADDPKIQEWERLNQKCKQPVDDGTDNGFAAMTEIYRFDQRTGE